MSPGGGSAERLYAALLCLTPGSFRREAAAEMLSVFRDGLHDARRSRQRLALLRSWLSTLRNLWRTARHLRRHAATLHPRFRSRSLDRAHMIELALKDLRYAIRSLARSPGFSIVIVLTLALVISAIVQIRCIPGLTV